jgi:formate hydrogenlyase subunit 4
MNAVSGITLLAGLILAPLLLGIINRTKAFFAGRHGSPLLQAYFDLGKLLRKGAVYSRSTSWIFRAAPAVGLASVLAVMTLLPISVAPAPFSFAGDIILFAYCLGLMRFFTVIAALDTASAFEGMGASREVQFSALAEPALILGLATLARVTGSLSLTGIFSAMSASSWLVAGPSLGLVLVALLIVCLAENSRIPVDDPNTHLELTMIHEVMILDYSGPDLAFILYGASLKLWVLGALIVNLVLSVLNVSGPAAFGCFFGGMFVLAVVVGVIESVMARLSLLRVPQLLVGAGAFSLFAFTLVLRFMS